MTIACRKDRKTNAFYDRSVIQRVKPGKRIIEEGSFAAKGPVAILERCDAQKSLTRENGYSRWQIRHAVNNVRLRVLTSSS
jgi:hypothetical protein